MAVVSSRQNVKISQHYALVDRTVLEEGRVRSLSLDPADQFRGPCQYCRHGHDGHVGTILGWALQFHAVGHSRCFAGPEDGQFRCRTQVVAAQDRQSLMRCSPAVGRTSCLFTGPASFQLKARSPKYLTVSAATRPAGPTLSFLACLCHLHAYVCSGHCVHLSSHVSSHVSSRAGSG